MALWAKNPDKRLPPASTTKIVTGLLLARDVPPDQPVTASPNAAQTPGHALGMKPGETFRARDLLYAIMLASANDASVAAAEHIARTEPAFADRMNAFASQNHAPNTHFTNASGLPASGHYSTARDLAALARAALQNPRICQCGTHARLRPAALRRSSRVAVHHPLVNENTLLGMVPGMDGVKAGWTREAGACFVGSATRNGHAHHYGRAEQSRLEAGDGSAGKIRLCRAPQASRTTGRNGKTEPTQLCPSPYRKHSTQAQRAAR